MPWGLALVGGADRGGPRGDVEDLEGSAGPLGGADGGHRGRRPSEAAAGSAGRCHVTISSGGAQRRRPWPLRCPHGSRLLVFCPLGRRGRAPPRFSYCSPAAAGSALGSAAPAAACAPETQANASWPAPGSPALRAEVAWLPRTPAGGVVNGSILKSQTACSDRTFQHLTGAARE